MVVGGPTGARARGEGNHAYIHDHDHSHGPSGPTDLTGFTGGVGGDTMRAPWARAPRLRGCGAQPVRTAAAAAAAGRCYGRRRAATLLRVQRDAAGVRAAERREQYGFSAQVDCVKRNTCAR